MAKVSMRVSNDYCPQTLFMYGTFKENGEPNFGLFCWFSYCYFDDLGVMACIGGQKTTLDRIRQTKVFSANLVTEHCLALADYFGTVPGTNTAKMAVPFGWERGAKLNVPILKESPFAFELEVVQFVPVEGGEVLLCKVCNVMADEVLADSSLSPEEKLRAIAPVSTTCMTYFGWHGGAMGKWHEPGKVIGK